jgi:hypothetical protein
MSKQKGVIYQINKAEFGLALYHEQLDSFSKFDKVYVYLFEDRLCTRPKLHPENGKNIVALKHISVLKIVGFSD